MAMARERPYGSLLKLRADAGFHAYDDVDPANKPWRLLPQHGGGAMFDMGVYALNAARYSSGREPIASPPGSGTTARRQRATSGPSTHTDARSLETER